jgi:hypothetical protein
MAGRARGRAWCPHPRGLRLVGHDRSLRQQRAEGSRDRLTGERSARQLGAGRGRERRRVGSGADGVGQRLERTDGIVAVAREEVHLAVLGDEVARLPWVGEEADRRSAVHHDELAEPVELRRGELRQVREPVQ